MNKYILSLLLGTITLLVQAQSDLGAKKVLDQVAKKYDSYKTAQADFSFHSKNAENESYTDQGTLYLNKTKNQFQIELKEQKIISDGISVWSVMTQEKEVQITAAETNSDAIGPHNLFTFYKTGFKYMGMSDEKVGNEKLKVIEMSPVDTKRNYFKIKVRLNSNQHIHDVTIFDKGGSVYTYKINALYVNHKISANTFNFSKRNYPDYELVDLR